MTGRHEPSCDCLRRVRAQHQGKLLCALALRARQNGTTKARRPTSQQRMMQSRVKTSRSGATVGADGRAGFGRSCGAANEVGSANQPDCGDMGGTLAGRSRVIHMLWNGFLSVGVEPADRPWSRRLMIWAVSGCTWRACAWTLWVSWVQAAGSGSALAESCGRREEPAIRAMNRLSAVMTATIDCRRRVSRALSRPTVAGLYKRRLGR